LSYSEKTIGADESFSRMLTLQNLQGLCHEKKPGPSTLSVINTEMLTTCAAVAHALGVLDVQIPF